MNYYPKVVKKDDGIILSLNKRGEMPHDDMYPATTSTAPANNAQDRSWPLIWGRVTIRALCYICGQGYF
jgi:hypothetical protein